ncbi:G2/mitotic-specific cyclin-B-like [Montipora capricornis]|uniref:G2/mitotic-specific cyclin-B-like n=1 Tax=Montipora foliosa TaxID=591990 RepID=UPI0035F15222
MAAVGRLGNVLLQDQENEQLLAHKAKFSRTRSRAVLADVGNKPLVHVSKVVGDKARKTLQRSEGTTGLVSKQGKEHDARKQQQTIDVGVLGEALDSCMIAKPENVVDIDKDDYSNPQLCAEYAQEIYHYMHKLEFEFKVPPNYMSQRTIITEKMRGILVDWLVQVHLRFRLLQETLYTTISILDRFLSVYDVSKENLQLAGVSAMLLASKYEEMYAPEIGDFVYITDNAYDKSQIRKMEGFIFKSLDFSIGKPLCLHFLRRNSKAGEVCSLKHTLAKYFMELTLVDYACVKFLPSEIAAASLYIAIKVAANNENDDCSTSDWTPTLEYYSMYSESKLLQCARHIALLVTKTLDGTVKLKAVYSKYTSSKFMSVSQNPCLKSSYIKHLASEASENRP